MPEPATLMVIVFAILAYGCVTCVLATLAAQIRFHEGRHEVLLRTKQLRVNYLRHQRERQDERLQGAIEAMGSVDLVDNEPEPLAEAA